MGYPIQIQNLRSPLSSHLTNKARRRAQTPVLGSSFGTIDIQILDYFESASILLDKNWSEGEWNELRPGTNLENPEILLCQLPKIDSLVCFKVERQLASIPTFRSVSVRRAGTQKM